METISTYRIVVYVPSDYLSDFIQNVSPHIPSFLGNFDHVCWWSEAGTEQYRSTDDDKIEQKPSHRIEIYLPEDNVFLNKFISGIVVPNHPWDEPVITITTQKIVNHDK